jgi:SAM-dependent methyltransferase
MPLRNYESPEDYKHPAAYWRKIGKYYRDMIDPDDKSYKKQESWLLDCLNKLFYSQPIKTVLELGCGYGRITKHFLDYFHPDKMEVIDCSADQIMNLIAETKFSNYMQSRFDYHLMDILTEHFDAFALKNKNKFDLVIAVELLMHVPEEHIRKVIHNMLQLSKNTVISVDWARTGEYSEGITAPENFLHDYFELYKSDGQALHVSQCPINGIDQSIFMVFKDHD